MNDNLRITYMIIDSLHSMTLLNEGNDMPDDEYVKFVIATRDYLPADDGFRDELTNWLELNDDERYLLTDSLENYVNYLEA